MTSRRDTLRALGSFAALPFLGSIGVEELAEVGRRAHERARESGPRVLTPGQHEMVTQAAERIIPRTTTPGATDAKVADFIDTMLADWYAPAERDRFLAGLDALDGRAAAASATGRAFVVLDEGSQTEILTSFDWDVQRLRSARSADADRHWFAMLKFLTVWGFYTSRAGMVDELRLQVAPGRYDGNAPYAS